MNKNHKEKPRHINTKQKPGVDMFKKVILFFLIASFSTTLFADMGVRGSRSEDLDTGAGTDNVVINAIALPASGGAVVGGTATNPVRTDTTGTTTQPVSAVSLPLPSGAATAANQTTIIGHVDGLEALLGTMDADTSALAGAVSGSELQVDVVGALPAGTNNIGDVDVLSSALPTGAATLSEQQTQTTSLSSIKTSVELIDDTVSTLGTSTYAEATNKGLTLGAVRRDADTSLVDTTNEIGPLQMDSNGRLKVEAFSGETLPVSIASVPSHAVTNAGTFAVQESGAALTALQLIDDPVFTDDSAFTPATSKVFVLGAQVDDTATDSVDEGDAGAPRMSANRNLNVRIRDNAGNERGLNIDANGALAATVTSGATRSYKTYSATITSDTDVIAAVTSKKIKVYAYSIITTDNTGDTVIFKSNGTGGTEKWRVYLKGPDANTPFGANLAVAPGVDGAHIFSTAAGEKLTADVSSGATLHISIAYWDDDAA